MASDVERRSSHPFYMYEAIQAQPAAFARVAGRTAAEADAAAEKLAAARRVFIVGIGTSHHAAQIGEYLFEAYAGGVAVRAVHAFDFVLYGPALTPQDCVIVVSHRGTKRYSADALARARAAGCPTILITGEGEASRAAQADTVFYTVPQEVSAAHTISFTAALAALAVLAERVGLRRTGTRPFPGTFLSEDLPAALRTALASESTMARLAREHLARRRLFIIGGGPGAVAAQETALKIRETSYLQAEGMQVEAILHGPLLCAESADLFILIAPAGAAQPRVVQFAGAVREIGAACLVVSDGTPQGLREQAAGWCTVPAIPEPLSALMCLVPLQLLSYHLALERGTNPDVFRMDDPRFARIRALVPL